jgi:hypothetical protein
MLYYAKDEGYCTLPIGFTFYYMGMPYNKLTVFTNGFVTFNPVLLPSNNFRNDALFANDTGKADDLQNRILAPWWDDMTLIDAGADAYFKLEGTAPNRTFTVEWVNIRPIGYTGVYYRYQVVIHESSNIIEFRYGPKIGGPANHSASAGIKDSLCGDAHFFDIFGVSSAPPNPLYNYSDYPYGSPYTNGSLITYTPYP